MPADPRTPRQWHEAVDAAAFFQAFESARLYGLITTEIRVDVERCDEILRRGAALGYKPRPVEDLAQDFLHKEKTR